MENKKIAFVNLLRSIAIILVVIGHYFEFNYKWNNIAGVDIFFVLSGYLICNSLQNQKFVNTITIIKVFLINRLLKIFPSFILFFILSILILNYLKISISDIPTISEWKQYLFFYRNYGGPPARYPFEHLWSLSCEVQFYFILLITYIVIKDKNRLLIFWILIWFASALWKFQAVFTLIAEWPTYTHNRIDAFALGVIFALKPNWNLKFNNYLLIILVGIFIFFQIYNFSIDNHRLINRIVIPILVFILLNQKIEIYNQTIIKICNIISKYSYNLYLWHFLVLYILNSYKVIWDFELYIFISILLSFLFTNYIEIPFLKIKSIIINTMVTK